MNLFAQHIQGIWPPAISIEANIVQVELAHFDKFLRHFLKTECYEWGWVTGPHFDLDGTRLDILQELRWSNY